MQTGMIKFYLITSLLAITALGGDITALEAEDYSKAPDFYYVSIIVPPEEYRKYSEILEEKISKALLLSTNLFIPTSKEDAYFHLYPGLTIWDDHFIFYYTLLLHDPQTSAQSYMINELIIGNDLDALIEDCVSFIDAIVTQEYKDCHPLFDLRKQIKRTFKSAIYPTVSELLKLPQWEDWKDSPYKLSEARELLFEQYLANDPESARYFNSKTPKEQLELRKKFDDKLDQEYPDIFKVTIY